MIKLTQLRPLVGRLPPMLGPASGDEKERNRYRADSEPWRKLYNTARWKRLRLVMFRRDHFICQMCRRIESNTAKLVCDHITPHKGDEALFWDQGNLQTVCKPCHDSEKQKQERAQARW